MLFLKTFKDAKFVVDGNAFQTFINIWNYVVCMHSVCDYEVESSHS